MAPSLNLCKDDSFAWNPKSCEDQYVGRAIMAEHNKLFKNNEHYDDDYIEIIKNTDIDCLFLEADEPIYSVADTATTASLTSSEDDETLSVATADSASSAGNAPKALNTNDAEGIPNDIECHAVYPEDEEVCYMVPVPKNGKPRDLSLTPISIMVIETIGAAKSKKVLKVLFDPGSSKTMISSEIVPKKATAKSLSTEKKVNTIAGAMMANKMVYLRNIKLPEFDKNRKI